jgi:hypothetical protein
MARRRYWCTELTLAGWAVWRVVRRRPTAASPRGYTEHVTAPGSPFDGRETALAVARELNAPKRRTVA